MRQLAYDRRERLAPASVALILAILRAILNQACEDEVIDKNPVTKGNKLLPKNQKAPRVIDPFNRDELTLLLTTMQDYRPVYYPFFLTLARTGVRLGEALALKWDDVDWHGQMIHVQRGYSERRITTPKNGKTRLVDMSSQLSETLRSLLTQRKTETLQREDWQDMPEWIFCSSTGGLLSESLLRSRVWRPCLSKAGLRYRRMHDLRHTYATILIQQKESLAYIRDQLGHHSIKLTVDTYGHLVPGGNRQAVNRLDDENLDARNRNLSATTSYPRWGRQRTTS
ncbi:MAG: site-specific integrase [Candidatus Tectomicrobia bacterium]